MAETFEDEEHRRFGQAGFQGVVAKVADIERSLLHLRPEPIHPDLADHLACDSHAWATRRRSPSMAPTRKLRVRACTLMKTTRYTIGSQPGH